MRINRIVATGVIAMASFAFGCGQQQSSQTAQQQPQQQGQTYGTNVPGQQSSAQGDQAMQQQLRKAIEAEPGMKAAAESWQVKVANGKVTLTGTVASEEEHQKILATVKRIAGDENVTDELKVAPAQPSNGQAQPSNGQAQP